MADQAFGWDFYQFKGERNGLDGEPFKTGLSQAYVGADKSELASLSASSDWSRSARHSL